MTKVCVEASFSAAHFLPGHPKCGKIHGHNYKVRAEIEGKVDKKTGMVVDFGEVKGVLRNFDHENLNPLFYNKVVQVVPTAENLAQWFADEINTLGGFHLVKVTVWETEDCSATVQMLGVKH